MTLTFQQIAERKKRKANLLNKSDSVIAEYKQLFSANYAHNTLTVTPAPENEHLEPCFWVSVDGNSSKLSIIDIAEAVAMFKGGKFR